jgi:BirA family biotin operon repressor/biotin-[acetyl-CoA-carboxylase] ligase
MRNLSLANPFGAPVYWAETVSSTMDEARRLAGEGAAHGAVIAADFQEAGRGRIRGRPWLGGAGESLFATIILRYPGIAAIPRALTLRTGLALAAAIEDFAPALTGRTLVKWPNDIMISSGKAQATGKAAGILTEGDGKTVYIGFGMNVAQTGFPGELARKAVSIAMALAPALVPESRFVLLEKILARLHGELEGPADGPPGAGDWRAGLEARLYMRGRPVRFIEGAAGSGRVVEGILTGIGKDGELLIQPPGASEPLAFVTGELAFPELEKK